MQVAEPHTDSVAGALAREYLYRFMASSISDPLRGDPGLLMDAKTQRLASVATDLLRAEAEQDDCALGFGELPAQMLTLDGLLEELRKPLEARREEYDRIFGLLTCRECPPYETEYHPSKETFYRAQQMADIAGFYRAFGLCPAHTRPERPDHIVLELEFMSFLLMKRRCAEADASSLAQQEEWETVCDEAQRNFFRDHLSWWLPAFALGLRRKAETGLFAMIGQVLGAFLPLERRRFDLPAPRWPLQPAFIERPDEQDGCMSCPVSSP